MNQISKSQKDIPYLADLGEKILAPHCMRIFIQENALKNVVCKPATISC